MSEKYIMKYTKYNININSIKISEKPHIKCIQCREYGERPSCPNSDINYEFYKKLISNYKNIEMFEIEINNYNKEIKLIQKSLLNIEKSYLNENPYCFVTYPSYCKICDKCDAYNGNCSYRDLCRPSLSSLGIELDSIVSFKKNCVYSLIFIN